MKPITITRVPLTSKSTGNPRYDRHELKVCQRCNNYYLPKSPKSLFCDECSKIHEREKSLQRWKDNGRKQTNLNNFHIINGKKVYIKSGYNQSGSNNNNFKNGTGVDWFQEAVKILPKICNRCGKEYLELHGKIQNLLLHHKDGNHFNNNPDNWEILCKSCHQNHHSNRGSDGRFISNKG